MHNPDRFDLILMDVQMPGMDGYEATRRLRADGRFDDLPVLAIPAHVLGEDRRRCRESGMDDFNAKPFDHREFAETLGRWLGHNLKRDDNAAPSEGLHPKAGIQGLALPLETGGWIDLDAGIRGVGGDPALYRRLIDGFRASYERASTCTAGAKWLRRAARGH